MLLSDANLEVNGVAQSGGFHQHISGEKRGNKVERAWEGEKEEERETECKDVWVRKREKSHRF